MTLLDMRGAESFARSLEVVAKHVDDDTAPIAGHMVIAAALLELAAAIRGLPTSLEETPSDPPGGKGIGNDL